MAVYQVPIDVGSSNHFIKLPSLGFSPKFIVISAVLPRRKSCFYCPRHPGSGAGSTVLVSLLLQLSPRSTADTAADRSTSKHFLVLHRRCNMLESQILEKLLTLRAVDCFREEICRVVLSPYWHHTQMPFTFSLLPQKPLLPHASRCAAVGQLLQAHQHAAAAQDALQLKSFRTTSYHTIPVRLAAGQRNRRPDIPRVPHRVHVHPDLLKHVLSHELICRHLGFPFADLILAHQIHCVGVRLRHVRAR